MDYCQKKQFPKKISGNLFRSSEQGDKCASKHTALCSDAFGHVQPHSDFRLNSKFFRADPGKCSLGTHNSPPRGKSICCCLFLSPSQGFVGSTSFFFFTNSKNSATWRAYLEQNQNRLMHEGMRDKCSTLVEPNQ